ncbi:hypothetical protein [Phytomonospora endophytica]|uniref:Uncharacterized protein n=1 Tax=Phytomonospora endophytica TaxID=714109 RepID=A0A841FU35_9ACTN|nr:hypothetical protein [Phytomonospora endophytica]MBB6039516.1 hypothetical protein [Phytomonospora endophytica]GIG70480.1 hypothetical protein Pen01_67750 [Phytomonospora endophytica]
MKATHREYVRAIAVGDSDKIRELDDLIPESEWEEFHTYVAAFFSLMLEQRFANDSSRDAISAFVNEMRSDYRNMEPPMKPLMVEAVIRASAGEEHLFSEVPPRDTVDAHFLVIGKIARQSDDVQTRLDHYLSEAEGLAAQWAVEDT